MNKYKNHILIFLLLAFHLINNAVWLKIDRTPPGWDQSRHLNLSIDYFNWYKEDLLKLRSGFAEKFLNISYFYPPLYHMAMTPVYLVFGIDEDKAVLVNAFYLCLALLAIYGIGKLLCSETTGLLAAFIFSMYQFWLLMTRNYLIESALTAFVALSYYFFIKSSYFRNRKYSILFGLACGLGMLAKWSFVFFIFGVVVLAIVGLFKDKFRNILNFTIAAVSALILILPWYAWNTVNILTGFVNNMNLSVVEGDPNIFTTTSFLYYMKALYAQVHPVFFILFAVGMAYYFACYKKENNIILIWLLSSYLILVLVRNKDLRFSVPLLPAVAIVSAFCLDFFKGRAKSILVSFIIIFGLFQFYLFTYSNYSRIFPVISGFDPPNKADWHYADFYNALQKNLDVSKDFTTLTVASNNVNFHMGSFRFWAKKNNLKVIVRNRDEEVTKFSDFVVFKTGNKGPESEDLAEANRVEDSGNSFHKIFKQVAAYDLPDGSRGILFKKNPEAYQPARTLEITKQKIIVAFRGYFDRLEKPKVTIIEYSPERSKKGDFREIDFSAEHAVFNGLKVNGVNIALNNVYLNMLELYENRKLVVVSLNELEPKIRISRPAINDYFSNKIKSFREMKIEFKNDGFAVTGKYIMGKSFTVPISIYGQTVLDRNKKEFGIDVKKIVLFKYLTVPRFVYLTVFTKKVSLEPDWNWPAHTKIGGIITNDEGVEVF